MLPTQVGVRRCARERVNMTRGGRDAALRLERHKTELLIQG